MIRAISFTEGSTLLTCQARWDFAYGGRLAGTALKKKDTAVILREGRAWGRVVAAFHAAESDRLEAGMDALLEALEEDVRQQLDAGFYDAGIHEAVTAKLKAEFRHYAGLTEPLNLSRLEHELFVPLPSRSGKGDSNRYRLQVLFDGIHVDDQGRAWIVEFKLRGQLSSAEQIANSRQIRYYAWAWWRETGQMVTGVIVDERLNEVPKPARWVQSKKKEVGRKVEEMVDGELKVKWMVPSHAVDQVTTPDAYVAACAEVGVESNPETVEAIAARQWAKRETVFLTADEIEEAGEELVSLGRQVQQLDSEAIYPVRNVKPQNCNGCFFREICNHPKDAELVDVLFNRTAPKRDRPSISQSKEVSS